MISSVTARQYKLMCWRQIQIFYFKTPVVVVFSFSIFVSDTLVKEWMAPQVNVMTWPILSESSEGSRRRYRIITAPGYMVCFPASGVIWVAHFFLGFFKGSLYSRSSCKEWMDGHCQGIVVMAGPIRSRSALVVISRKQEVVPILFKSAVR